MTEPTTHTFDLFDPATVTECTCGCGARRVPVQPTHTVTHWVVPVPQWPSWLPPLKPRHCLMLDGGLVEIPTLSPEWADALWELAQQPERPTLEPSRRLRVRVLPWMQPRDRVFRRDDLTLPGVCADLLMTEMRRVAALKLLTEFELAASEREDDLIYGDGPGRPKPMTYSEAAWKADRLLQRMEADGEISFT